MRNGTHCYCCSREKGQRHKREGLHGGAILSCFLCDSRGCFSESQIEHVVGACLFCDSLRTLGDLNIEPIVLSDDVI
jgi:hypothetical protein